MANKFDPNGDLDPKSVRARTDVMFQQFSVYIEGVQVPFMSMNIRTGLGSPPEMSLQIPSQTGLMEICRYYEPKVHVFFTDPISGKDCVFFMGVITGANYVKSSTTPPRKYISFNVRHKYSQLELITLDYSGYANDSNANVTDQNANQAAIKPSSFNSAQSIGMALTGVDGAKIGGKAEINLKNVRALGTGAPEYNSIPEELRDVAARLEGFPGVMLNLWNQLKAQVYQDSSYHEVMTRLYIPLVEQGLQLFKRIGGHHYLEEKINSTKEAPCGKESDGTNALMDAPRMVPPGHKSFMISSIQADISTQVIATAGQFSGEMTSFMQVLQNLIYAIEYDMVFLNAPAEVPKNPKVATPGVDTSAMDVIIKPQMPHYYAPLCNVVLPYMYDSISVNQDESAVPTRVTAVSDLVPGSTGQFGTNFRAPQSVREAVSRGISDLDNNTTTYSSLARTTAGAHFKVGKYEQGRGIRHQRLQLPSWLAMLSESLTQQSPSDSETKPAADSEYGIEIDKFRRAWQYRYDPTNEKKQLNPWDDSSEINGYQRLLFSASDYRYTTEVAKARTGSVSMIFNPYIVPGYPMDIIDPSPTEPSFHAFCVSVSHTITARSVGTSAEFVSAMTYSELGNYEQQYVNPWLHSVLKTLSETPREFPTQAERKAAESRGEPLTEFRSSIVNNVEARDAAAEFYLSTLGVGAAPPEQLYDFATGRPYPFEKMSGLVKGLSEGSAFNHVSGEGNLYLAYRPIETKEQVAERFGIKFIDLAPDNYDPIVFSYKQPVLEESKLMEPGQSPFLSYTEVPDFSREESDLIQALSPDGKPR